MKKRLSCFLLLLLITRHTHAQNTLPPLYEIKTDTGDIITLPRNYWQILEDPTDNLRLNQVTSLPLSSKFHPDSSNTKGIDYSIRTNWLRFRFINKMARPIDLVFLNMKTNRRDMYLFKGGSLWKHLINGSFVPWSLRDGYKREASIEITMPPGEELIVYQRNYVSRPFRKADAFRYSFMFKEKFLQNEGFTSDNEQPPYLTTLRDGFLLGFLIFASLLTLFFFFIVWQRLYLYYALFLFIYCIAASPLDEVPFFREHNYTQYVFEIFAFPVFSFFLVQFIRLFLQTRLHYPRWDKFVNWYSFLCVFISVIIYLGAHSASAKSSDILQDTFYLLTYINLINMFSSFAVSIKKQVAPDRPLLYITLPALFVFTTVGFSIPVFLFLQHLFNIDNTALITKIGDLQQLCDMISISFFALTFFVILFKRYSLLQKEVVLQTLEKERLAREKEIERNQLIEKQNLELESKVEARTNELRNSINELKSAQSQLIQAEKMASLGELTAGIAHEIQNPLNFVNNFSEVNTELISEMNDEIEKGNFEDAKSIANDIKENQQKINHHGRRADTIVKGMLQHSRASSGKKEPADINALADEYLRLSYHGLRAKDKSFNAAMHTGFDESIQKINIVPQDIGRVLLNLYNNAFYAVCEKKKNLLTLKEEKDKSHNEYEPTVTVTTKAVKSPSGDPAILISIKDNGNGIPQKAWDKIFQPFFTTKPTGQGTGLGLSLSYDIIRAHGGEIKFETREGEFTKFTIQLPAVP